MLQSKKDESGHRNPKEAVLSEFFCLQLISSPLSTSPHSFQSMPSSLSRRQAPSTDRAPPSQDPVPPALKINVYGSQYLISESWQSGEIEDLWSSMEEWKVSKQTKMSIKLMVAKRLWQMNPRYYYLFHATVQEYQDLVKQSG